MCVYIHVYQVITNWGPGPQNSLRHTDNRKYFLRLSLTQNRGKAHVFYLARKARQIWRCSCWGKGNSIMINELKYGQTWTIWPSHLVYHRTKPLKVMKPITQQTFTSSKLTIKTRYEICSKLTIKIPERRLVVTQKVLWRP